MIDLIKLNKKAFLKNKKCKNYIIINLLIVFLILILIFVKSLCKYEIDNILDDKGNRNFIVSSYENKKDLLNFFGDYGEYIRDINYNIKVNSININDKKFIIKSYSNDFNENEYSILINAIYNGIKIALFKLNIKKIMYETNINERTIFVNQKLSKYIFENDLEDSSIINFTVKSFSLIDDINDLLKKYGIEANTNVDSYDTLNLYNNINNILNLFFIFFFITIIIIIFLLNYNFLKEDMKNIFIYKVLGLDKIKSILIYITSFSFIIIIIYFGFIALLFFLIIIFNYLCVDFLIIFVSALYYLILFSIFHFLIISVSIALLIKY